MQRAFQTHEVLNRDCTQMEQQAVMKQDRGRMKSSLQKFILKLTACSLRLCVCKLGLVVSIAICFLSRLSV